jgi:hypothetical protein
MSNIGWHDSLTGTKADISFQDGIPSMAPSEGNT